MIGNDERMNTGISVYSWIARLLLVDVLLSLHLTGDIPHDTFSEYYFHVKEGSELLKANAKANL